MARTRFTGANIEAARRLRREQTRSERLLWEVVRAQRFHGLKFRRQHPVGSLVLDFYCDDFNLAVEVDATCMIQWPRKPAMQSEPLPSRSLVSACCVSRPRMSKQTRVRPSRHTTPSHRPPTTPPATSASPRTSGSPLPQRGRGVGGEGGPTGPHRRRRRAFRVRVAIGWICQPASMARARVRSR
ncbi:MAG: DUF559 domain-containing protein [Dehalococcoidia bacterium]|nr:DUF559 domain-containing protein [Dehalococcoidia bacterium]